MKKEIIGIGLAIYALAGLGGVAQEIELDGESATVSATAEAETDITTEVDGKKQRRVRIERRLPGRAVEVEEFTEDDLPEDDLVEVRPQIRVYPRERELIIRRGPPHRETRIDLHADAAPQLDGEADPMEHLDEAIRHLRKAKLADAAARLEGERATLRARREVGSQRLTRELKALREERDALREELRKLREELEQLRAGSEPEKSAEQ